MSQETTQLSTCWKVTRTTYDSSVNYLFQYRSLSQHLVQLLAKTGVNHLLRVQYMN